MISAIYMLHIYRNHAGSIAILTHNYIGGSIKANHACNILYTQDVQVALTILCPCLQSHNILFVDCKRRLAPRKTTVDDECHQDREGVGHEVADPEEVWWSLEVMMGRWMPGESCGNLRRSDKEFWTSWWEAWNSWGKWRPWCHFHEISFIFAKGCYNMVISTTVDSNPGIFIHREGGGVPCTFPLHSADIAILAPPQLSWSLPFHIRT